MRIKKIFNDNIILTEEKEGEMIVIGQGLAFQKKAGDLVDESQIDKTFVLKTRGVSEQLETLINETPPQHLDIADEIIQYAKTKLPSPINDNIYLSLTDHISYAISRFEQGLTIKNTLLWEVKKLYPTEYEIALHALRIIEIATELSLPEDEAGFITLHLVNAQQEKFEIEETVTLTKIVTDILEIVKYHYGLEIDPNSINYNRFVTHLRYLAYCILRNEWTPEEDGILYEQVKRKYPDAYLCARKVSTYIETTYKRELNKDEMLYFMLHIQRVTNRGEHKA
ncbi:PRD domain-containing protein [Bacillus sp. AGMB 02131]|uniref:PRD domain-containing protein n=1 Tax=Peribacillus faecalis TaxID=2772559 RepID=A0A927CTY2_9BACI|nr:PRD domain-containing protein [Peribacillus faecalis]MBD3107503.1 PRD domain-containing protein [Peribacillus faecalis]